MYRSTNTASLFDTVNLHIKTASQSVSKAVGRESVGKLVGQTISQRGGHHQASQNIRDQHQGSLSGVSTMGQHHGSAPGVSTTPLFQSAAGRRDVPWRRGCRRCRAGRCCCWRLEGSHHRRVWSRATTSCCYEATRTGITTLSRRKTPSQHSPAT